MIETAALDARVVFGTKLPEIGDPGRCGCAAARLEPSRDTQVHQAFHNIEETLARAGGRLQDVVTMTAFIIDASYSERFIAIRKEYFPSGDFPCSALIVAAGFAKPGIMVEIQTIAVVESG